MPLQHTRFTPVGCTSANIGYIIRRNRGRTPRHHKIPEIPDVLFAETLPCRKGGLIKAQGRFYGWISSTGMPNLLTIDINCVPWTIKFGCGPSFLLPPSRKAYKIDVRKQLALWVQFFFSFSNIIVRIYSPPFFSHPF